MRFELRAAGVSEPIPLRSEGLRELAMEWAVRVRGRDRRAEADSESLERRAAETLRELLPESDADRAAARQVLTYVPWVEVGAVYDYHFGGWETRILPWEYLLRAATRAWRADRPLLVTRHLQTETNLGQAGKGQGHKAPALIAVCAPGRLRDHLSSRAEPRVLAAALGLGEDEVSILENPTESELASHLSQDRPALVHLAGFDSHQGSAFLGLPHDSQRADGLYIFGDDGGSHALGARELAELLTRESTPSVLTVSCWNSAPRICAEAVAHGVKVAVGCEGELSSYHAELFFTTLMLSWRQCFFSMSAREAAQAFRLAQARLGEVAGETRTDSVVLWTSESLEERDTRYLRADLPANPARELQDLRSKALVEDQARAEQERQSEGSTPGGTGKGFELLDVECRPLETVNYSLLHNDRNLFETFKLRKFHWQEEPVYVEVELIVGADRFPYRAYIETVDLVTDLTDRVRVPLTWEFVRSLRESIRSTLHVRVSSYDTVRYENTFPLTLLPLDEWRDNRRDGIWLPSFVLPRDPAVAAVVDQAQKYLMSLADDGEVGFDGYQSDVEGVDLQVRALWSALVFDRKLGYIEPPPTYTAASQRLRGPGEVLDGGRGTCIDLALLLSACLEYVGIHPVIFLLTGHAFPGYWRSRESHQTFTSSDLSATPGPLGDLGALGFEAPIQRCPWLIESQSLESLLEPVANAELVPLETVLLTRNRGFLQAYDEGIANLGDSRRFEGMVDVTLARQAGVTPLPLRGSSR